MKSKTVRRNNRIGQNIKTLNVVLIPSIQVKIDKKEFNKKKFRHASKDNSR